MQTMHGGREELVPKYQISPVTHPVSARAPCVHYHYEDTRYSWHSAMRGIPGVSRVVLSTSLLMALLLYCGTGHQRSCSEQLWHAENGAGAGTTSASVWRACDCSDCSECSDWWPPWAGKKAEICVSQGPGRWRCEACPIFISRISHFLISFHNNTIIKISSGAIPGYFGISSLILSTRPTWG